MCEIITIFDLETDGLPKFYDAHINEYGFRIGPYKHIHIYSAAFIVIKVMDGKVISKTEKYMLIKPYRDGKEIPVLQSDIHGLNKIQLDSYGIDIEEFCVFAQKVISITNKFVGHNVGYDIGVLIAELSRYPNADPEQIERISHMSLNGSYFCTAQNAKKKISRSKKLADVYEAYIGEVAFDCHNAKSDAEMCYKIYLSMKSIEDIRP